MRGIGGSTLRGGQTVFHAIRMWGQLFRAAVFFAAFTTVAVPAWTLWHRTTGAEWYAAGMVSLAEVKLVLGYDPDSGQDIRFEDGTRRVLRIRDIAASVPAREARERIKVEMFASAGLGAMCGRRADRAVPGGVLGPRRPARPAETHKGRRNGDGRRTPPPGAAGRSARPGAPSRRQAASGPTRSRAFRIPERTETQHTIVSGTTGSGKTVLISDLVSQIREQGRTLRDLRQDGELHPRPSSTRTATCC